MARDEREGDIRDDELVDERDALQHEQQQRERQAGKRGKRTSPVLFFRQVMAELRKVVWPTRHQLITYSTVVVVFVLVVMTFVQALDFGFGKLAFWVFSK